MEQPTAFVFESDAVRRTRILRLLETSHEEHRFWRTALLYGAWTGVAAGVCGVPLFGLWWRSESLMWAAFAASAGLTLLVLAVTALLALTGRMTCRLLVAGERVDLGETEMTYRVTRKDLRFWSGSAGATYIWAVPYDAVTRMDYDRGAKTLRVHGRHREEGCRKPPPKAWPRAPRGMVGFPDPERRQDKDFFVDIPLYYTDSVTLLQELEQRTGVFIFPAMRGDDYADLRDLPGLAPRRSIHRPLALYLAALCLGTLWVARDARQTAQTPWQPYPPTSEEALARTHRLGGSVILDGCRVTLERADPGRDGGINVTLLFENLNEDMPVLLHLGKREPNLTATALTPLGETECNYIPPDNPLVLLAPGGAYHHDVLYALPKDTSAVILEINSDRWASSTHFWEPEYLGRPVVVNGMETLHNRVRFQIKT
ncbi:MAG: hypothetical protein FWG93_00540 [Oscillospiraceae bacterium]|nr:hypothetical protein [Oscillospiraceae bacterium]